MDAVAWVDHDHEAVGLDEWIRRRHLLHHP
jgi:hypothetical protein